MNGDQRWVVAHFLKSLLDIKPRSQEPPHRIDMRLQLAEMVLTELPGRDLEELVHRDHAEAVRNFYLTPNDPDRHERYELAVRAYSNMLKSLQHDEPA